MDGQSWSSDWLAGNGSAVFAGLQELQHYGAHFSAVGAKEDSIWEARRATDVIVEWICSLYVVYPVLPRRVHRRLCRLVWLSGSLDGLLSG